MRSLYSIYCPLEYEDRVWSGLIERGALETVVAGAIAVANPIQNDGAACDFRIPKTKMIWTYGIRILTITFGFISAHGVI